MVSRFLSVRQPAAAAPAGLIAIDRSADDEVIIGGLENVLSKNIGGKDCACRQSGLL